MHIEYQPRLEAEDSFQTGLAPNEPTGLDLEPSDDSIRGAEAEVGQADVRAQQVCIGAPVNK